MADFKVVIEGVVINKIICKNCGREVAVAGSKNIDKKFSTNYVVKEQFCKNCGCNFYEVESSIKFNTKDENNMSDLNEKNLGNDIVELAKVWNSLSDDMQKLLAKAIAGEEYAEGIRVVIGEIGKSDENFYECVGNNLMNFTNYIREGVNTIKELDGELINLKKTTDK